MRHEIELSELRLDLEYEELSLQRRRLGVQEMEIAIKREKLSLSSIEETAYMTIALDRDVQSRVKLGAINHSATARDQIRQVNKDQEARDVSKTATSSDKSTIEFSQKPTTAGVLKSGLRVNCVGSSATKKKPKMDIGVLLGIKYSPISPGCNKRCS
jgi:hypothetical protein